MFLLLFLRVSQLRQTLRNLPQNHTCCLSEWETGNSNTLTFSRHFLHSSLSAAGVLVSLGGRWRGKEWKPHQYLTRSQLVCSELSWNDLFIVLLLFRLTGSLDSLTETSWSKVTHTFPGRSGRHWDLGEAGPALQPEPSAQSQLLSSAEEIFRDPKCQPIVWLLPSQKCSLQKELWSTVLILTLYWQKELSVMVAGSLPLLLILLSNQREREMEAAP